MNFKIGDIVIKSSKDIIIYIDSNKIYHVVDVGTSYDAPIIRLNVQGDQWYFAKDFKLASCKLPEVLECPKCGVLPNPGCLCTGGYKADQDKPDMSLLSTNALFKMAQVMSAGRKKYTAHNWRAGMSWSRCLAAAGRHLYAYIGGEDKDPETGFSHLAHCACCIMFLLEYEDTHKELDDRYKKP